MRSKFRPSGWSIVLALVAYAVYGQEVDGNGVVVDPGQHLQFVTGWFVLGGSVLLILPFYLVNHHDKDIRKATWVMLSNTVSLLCAILIFKSWDKLIRLVLQEVFDGDWGRRLQDEPYIVESSLRRLGEASASCGSSGRRLAAVSTNPESVALGFIEMFLLFVVVESFLLVSKKHPRQLAAWGLIGAHIIGFSALEAFYPLQLMGLFSAGPLACSLVVVIAFVVLCGLCVLGAAARRYVASFDNEVDIYEERWLKQCEHTEGEFIGFALGFLISVVVRYALADCIPQLHWMPEDTGTQAQTMILLGVCILFGLLIGLGTLVKTLADDGNDEHVSRLERVTETFELTMAMSTGWCFHFWGYWQFWQSTGANGIIGEGNVMVARLVLVLLFTLLSFACLLIIDTAADRSHKLEEWLRSLSESFLLLVGLSWEAVFMDTMDSIHPADASQTQKTLVTVGLSFTLVLFVLPAWTWYIIPHAGGHRLSAAHAHGDHGDYGSDAHQDDHGSHGLPGPSPPDDPAPKLPGAAPNLLEPQQSGQESTEKLPLALVDDARADEVAVNLASQASERALNDERAHNTRLQLEIEELQAKLSAALSVSIVQPGPKGPWCVRQEAPTSPDALLQEVAAGSGLSPGLVIVEPSEDFEIAII